MRPKGVQREDLEVRPSPIHGNGLFTRRAIRKGTYIIEYIGEKITKEESKRRLLERNPYIFDLDEQWDLDGNVPENLARFINHSCSPNCEARNENGHIWIVALRDIQPGEELTFNYGYDLKNYRDYPCRCGSPNCVGYIVAEEFFDEVRRREGKPVPQETQVPSS